MAMTAKQFCSRKYHLRNAYDADENAAGARDEGNTPDRAAADFEGFLVGCD